MTNKTRRWKLIISLVTLALLAILVYVVRDQIAQTIDYLGQVNTWALLLMIPLQAINYDAYTRMYRDIFGLLDTNVPYKPMLRVQLEMNFVNHILPSGGVSGFSYFGARMRDYGVPASKSTLVQFMRFILIFISFQALLLFGVLSLAVSGQANNFVILISSSIVTLLIVGTFCMAYILGSKQRINSFSAYITRAVNRFIHMFRRHHPETIELERVKQLFNDMNDNYLVLRQNYNQLKRPLYYSFIANLTEVLTLYAVFIAFGELVNPGAVILAYAVANFAGLISFLPGGLGVYEFLMIGVFKAAGVSAGLSVPVVVMYRIISMTIQLVPGYFAYYRNLHKKSPHVI